MRPSSLGVALLLAAAPAALAAQATGDQARLVFSVGAGYLGGGDIWRVEGQPIFDGQNRLTDLANLERRLQSSWAVNIGSTFYRGEHLGLGLDLFLVNLRTVDRCQLTTSSGSANTIDACRSIAGATRNALSSEITASATYRFNSRGPVSPYLRANGGFILANVNTVRMSGFYEDLEERIIEIPVYASGGTTRVAPVLGVGAGITVPVSRAYHLRFEGRATTYSLAAVDGPTANSGLEPEGASKWVTQFSLTAGVDLVLERRRGRRY